MTYAEAQAVLHPSGDKETFFDKISKMVETRLPGGTYCKRIKTARSINRAARSKESRLYLRCCILNAVLGNKLTDAIFGKLKRKANEYAYDLIRYDIPYCRGGFLYHFADERTLDSIRIHGLKPGIFGKRYVFMTDDPERLSWFPAWKTERLKRDAVICLLKIDAKASKTLSPISCP